LKKKLAHQLSHERAEEKRKFLVELGLFLADSFFSIERAMGSVT